MGVSQAPSTNEDRLTAARTALGAAIAPVYQRLALGKLALTDIASPEEARFETPPGWIEAFVGRREVFEEDARILGRFGAETGTILDIGAHWGYMAASIRHAGSDCPILSFEPMPAHRRCLEELRRLDHSFDFMAVGLGERRETATLYGPVVNGQALMGLHSVGGSIFDARHKDYLLSLVGGEIPIAAAYNFKLSATTLRCRRLDEVILRPSWLASGPLRAARRRVGAIKLDVEGYEPQVLRGAEGLLARDRPFIMIESGNRNPGVVEVLVRHGYAYAERDGDRLKPIEGYTDAPNGFWLHPDHRAAYEAMGLV